MRSCWEGPDLQPIYDQRFAGKDNYRAQIWRVLASHFSQWFPRTGAVLDLGAGYCEFINSIPAAVRYAMDSNPDTRKRAAEGVTVIEQDCSDPWPLPEGELDAVFASNLLEHLPNKAAVITVLSHARRCLKPGGRFIAMGPNIKHVRGAYWDFFDHYVELTELSLAEALVSRSFEVERKVARFLPYTMSHGRQYPAWLLRPYLAAPALWRIFGTQFLVIGRRPLKADHPSPHSCQA